MLDERVINRFLAALASQDAPLRHALNPGLSEQEIDDLTAPLGLTLPTELKLWWGWRDGTDPYGPGSAGRGISAGRWFVQLAHAVADCQMYREIAAHPDVPSESWPHSYFPVVRSQSTLAADCSVPVGQPTPIRWIEPDRHPVEPDYGSFGEVVEIWCEALERRIWEYQPERGSWSTYHERMPEPGWHEGVV